MPANDYYDSTGAPSSSSSLSSSVVRAEFDLIEAAFNKLPALGAGANVPIFTNGSGTGLEGKSIATAVSLLGCEVPANKDVSGGYAGLTLLKINFMNALGTIKSFFTNANTVARTYTFPNKDGTVAMTSDITGTNSGTNTGDQIAATVSFTPSGTIAANTVQAAVEELDTETNASIGVISGDIITINATKAPLASPGLTGIPTTPTAAAGTSTTQIASTAFVRGEVATVGDLSFIHVQDQKAYNADGGSSAADAWTQRTLNTVVANTIAGASLAADNISLPAGTYIVLAYGIHREAASNAAIEGVFVDGVISLRGGAFTGVAAGAGPQYPAHVIGPLVLTGTSSISLRYYAGAAVATTGLGASNNNGSITDASIASVYAEVLIIKID